MKKVHIEINNKTILVTGSPGFIGASLVLQLLKTMDSGTIISLDSMNNHYDSKLKRYRLSLIEKATLLSPVNHIFIQGNIADQKFLEQVFFKYQPSIVVNLAAQTGVRDSINHPMAYIENNILGFFNVLETCRHNPVEHLVYASSSSVYGANKKLPFSIEDSVDSPVSLYAATKKSNELLAYCYAKLYNIPSTGLRLFSVYGPAGRPDMFFFNTTEKILSGEKFQIYNYGNCKRDFTYISDVVESVIRIMQGAPEKKLGEDGLPLPPYDVYNIGYGTPLNLLDTIIILQNELIHAGLLPSNHDFKAHWDFIGMQPGDIPITYADNNKLKNDYGYRPTTNIQTGLRNFVEWYKEYRKF